SLLFFFFFSSRRRHTRFSRDWSSDVCSSDLQADEMVRHYRTLLSHPSVQAITYWGISDEGWLGAPGGLLRRDGSAKPAYTALHRSEERRVGKECRSPRGRYHAENRETYAYVQ